MFLFMILGIILLLLALFVGLTISLFGAVAIVIFGDVIICGLLIIWIIKKLFFKKK